MLVCVSCSVTLDISGLWAVVCCGVACALAGFRALVVFCGLFCVVGGCGGLMLVAGFVWVGGLAALVVASDGCWFWVIVGLGCC